MSIEEIKRAKVTAEYEIKKIINDLEDNTGCKVSSIVATSQQTETYEGVGRIIEKDIEISLLIR